MCTLLCLESTFSSVYSLLYVQYTLYIMLYVYNLLYLYTLHSALCLYSTLCIHSALSILYIVFCVYSALCIDSTFCSLYTLKSALCVFSRLCSMYSDTFHVGIPFLPGCDLSIATPPHLLIISPPDTHTHTHSDFYTHKNTVNKQCEMYGRSDLKGFCCCFVVRC